MNRIRKEAGPVFYHGIIVGSMLADHTGFYLTRADEPALEAIKGAAYQDQHELHEAIAKALPAERKMELRAKRAEIVQQNRRLDEQAERIRAESTWTGDLYDPEKSIKQIASDIRDHLVKDVQAGALPAPADFRVSTTKAKYGLGPFIRVWTDHENTPDGSTVRDHIESVANRFNQSIGTGLDPTLDHKTRSIAFHLEVDAPSTLKPNEWRSLRRSGYTFDDIEGIVEARRHDRMRGKGFPEDKLPGGAA